MHDRYFPKYLLFCLIATQAAWSCGSGGSARDGESEDGAPDEGIDDGVVGDEGTGDVDDDDGIVPDVPLSCGNGTIDVGEICDGSELGGATCETVGGFTGGALACADDCTYDTSGCILGLDWLEDQPPDDRVTRQETNKLSSIQTYPRRSVGSMKQSLTSEQMACFDIIGLKAFSLTQVAAAQAINPDLSWLRIHCPQEWQGAADPPGKLANGYPFDASGPATANNEVFAGHWAYKPYTTLSGAIGTGAGITVAVADASKLQADQYCVIRPAGSWADAEHVLVSAVNTTTGVVTIAERGYRSTAGSWPAGSVIAQHQLGNGAGNLNWVYNMSTRCPADGNGNRANEALSAWLVNNYDKDNNGNPTAAECDGILYDSDFIDFRDGGSTATRNADFDNDGQADWGYDRDGTNHWGEGLEMFYAAVRAGVDARGDTDAVILGGVAESWGILSNNGTQLEAAWSHEFGEDGAVAGEYRHIGFYISALKAQTGHGVIGPRVTDVQGKEASAIYPGGSGETRNAPVRFSYAMSMLFDGAWFSNQNGFDDPFHYFDEDAVILTPGEDYGTSVPRTDTAAILQHNKWLGRALGPFRRVYDEALFGLDDNLLENGDFEAALDGGWTGTQASVARVTDAHYEGAASLHIVPDVPNDSREYDAAAAAGPSVALQASTEYTLVFAIRSDAPVRKIRVRLGSLSQVLFIAPGWNKHVLSWLQESDAAPRVRLEVGRDLTPVWIDQIYVFEGSADLFRRDFQNGMILANATPLAKTVELGGTFLRIQGNLDTEVNNGQEVTEVTLPPHDGLFLIRE